FVPLASTPEPSRRQWLMAIGTSVVGALVKYATGVASLLMTTSWVARASHWRERLLRLGLVAVVGLGIAVVLWWPWLRAPEAVVPILDAAGGRLVLNSAPAVVAQFAAERLALPLDEARVWARAVARAAFGLYLAWEVSRLWPVARRGGHEALLATVRASVRALLLLPLVVLTWVWSWYF